MQLHELDCFGEAGGGGNPALVIENGPQDAHARAALARERALTCVFIDPAGEDGIAATLDFVYPHMRSPLCLHATLAAAEVLFARRAPPLTVKTAMRGQRLAVSRADDALYVGLARQALAPPGIDADQAARLLAAPGLRLASAPQVASVGSPKLLLEVADPDTLHGLRPDLPAIAAWGRETGVNGCYVWCGSGNGAGEYEGRNFNHLDPLLEDSATGVAAGALTALLGHGLVLRQGQATGRACLMRTRIEGDTILVGGQVRRT